MSIKILHPEDCCGCSACASICPKNAITMKPDVMGFLYPKVDKDICVECGLCEQVCAFNDNYDTSENLQEIQAYGVKHKDPEQIAKSQSGAAFVTISDWILNQGGVVYGAGYTDHFRVVHKRATTQEERDEFRGSKYVQSDMGAIFREVKQDLKNGLIVLFSGTPCQVAGLKSYIGKKLQANLYLVDIICHGVPGPFLWRDYLAFLEKREGKQICWVNFRDKDYGWHAHKETFKYTGGGGEKMSYTYLFYQHIMLRKSCSKCPYTNTHRTGDLTISDFWGYEKTDPKIGADNKGLSLMLINTEKGEKLFENIKKDLNVWSAKLENCLQPNLCYPTAQHPKREQFEKDYVSKGFKYVFYKYGEEGWRFKMKQIIRLPYRVINKILRTLNLKH